MSVLVRKQSVREANKILVDVVSDYKELRDLIELRAMYLSLTGATAKTEQMSYNISCMEYDLKERVKYAEELWSENQ